MEDIEAKRNIAISIEHSYGITIEDLIDILQKMIDIDTFLVVKSAHIVLGNENKKFVESE